MTPDDYKHIEQLLHDRWPGRYTWGGGSPIPPLPQELKPPDRLTVWGMIDEGRGVGEIAIQLHTTPDMVCQAIAGVAWDDEGNWWVE